MKINDYFEEISECIQNYLSETNLTVVEDNFEEICDKLIEEDSITGNGSGSFYCSETEARKALQGNEDLYIDTLSECYDKNEISNMFLFEPETADCILRSMLVPQVLDSFKND